MILLGIRRAVLVLVFLLTATLATADSRQPVYRFQIPAGSLEQAFTAVQSVSGARITIPDPLRDAVSSASSPGLTGTFTVEQALQRLLAGTGFSFRLSGANAFLIDVQRVTESVEVTATPGGAETSLVALKSAVPLRDVPQSVSVVTRAMIDEQRMQGMADVVRYMPGVSMAQGEGNRDTPILRGNATTADFFVDGVRDDVQYFRDLYNVERVEALKGPNAMIFGRGGAGGVINRATRQADWSMTNEFSVQGGAHDNRRVSLDLGRPVNSAFAVRLTGMYEDSNSYRDQAGVERYGVNPTVTARLGSSTMLRAGYERFHDDRTADRGIPSFGDRPVPTSPSTFFGDARQSFASATVDAFNAVVDHRLGRSAWMRNRTRFANYEKFYQNVFAGSAVSADGQTLTLSAYNNATDRHNLFNQTDVHASAMTGAITHVIVVGAEFGRQVTDNFRNTGYFTSVGANATAYTVPVVAPSVSVPITFRQSATDADNHGVATVAAVYAQDQLELTPHVRAVVGIRADRFDVDFLNNRTGARITTTDNLVSPRAGLIVKPGESMSLYASYSLTYVPRAGEQLSSLSLTNQSLEPERFVNYEIGAKWDVRPALAVTAALYRLNRSNVAVPDPEDITRSLLVDGQRSKGVELAISGRVTRAWSVVGGYAYQDGRLTSTLSSSAIAGARIAQLPVHSFSLWNRYDVSRRWGAGVGVVRNGDRFTSTDNRIVLPGFTRVDGALFVNAGGGVEVQVNAENIFDTRYYPFAHSNNNITPGSPRALRVAVTARF
jgi:catecholate siderophore receptor